MYTTRSSSCLVLIRLSGNIEHENFHCSAIHAVRGCTILRTYLHFVSSICASTVKQTTNRQACSYRPEDETAIATDPPPPRPQIPTCGYHTLASNARFCTCSPIYLTSDVMASSSTNVEGLQDACSSHVRFESVLALLPVRRVFLRPRRPCQVASSRLSGPPAAA
jgi:hypothetical protein